MSQSVVKQLVSYRSWIVAVVNAFVTWIILIIAPLGLFAVIMCTLGVFLSSLVIGSLCDRALFQLMRTNNRDVFMTRPEWELHNTQAQDKSEYLPTQQHKEDRR